MSRLGTCSICEKETPCISDILGVCSDCLHQHFAVVKSHLESIHSKTRMAHELPTKAPKNPEGIQCNLCSNACQIGEGELGYCGLRTASKGKLLQLAGTPAKGLVEWYHDSLPTNCVADWICDGYKHPGCTNLAVFYKSCTANCLFCQNWHFRETSVGSSQTYSAMELASAARPNTFCACFFGGDPASQMPHALAAAKILAAKGIRICWETNGMMNPKLLDQAMAYSMQTGGCIKFDLKAFDEEIYLALTGISGKSIFENFTHAANRFEEQAHPPLVIASTLLVPGYVGADQVGKIADFIASINPNIPYSLLGFAPHCYMNDLPCTSAKQAREAENAAHRAGLVHVHIGNRHLLGIE
ncbi:MAG: radical SAM protein [Marinifilaceae bacterium]